MGARPESGEDAPSGPDEPPAASAASSSPPGDLSGAPASRATFKPAPRVPAPLRSSPPSKRFQPVAAMPLTPRDATEPAKGAVDDNDVLILERQKDLTPNWVYGTVLSVCVVGFFFSFVWWSSESDVMTTGWRTSFLILMAIFLVVGVMVGVKYSRKTQLGPRARVAAVRRAQGAGHFAVRRAQGVQNYARRRKQGMVQMVHQTRASVKQTGTSLKASGTHFREGFHGESEPNFLVKFLQRIVRMVVWVYVQLERLVLFVFRVVWGVLRLVYGVFVLVVRLAWGIYRGLVEPVLWIAYQITRWAARVVYYPVRGSLRLAWRILYWVVRRWPLVYATQALEAPVRVHVAPPLAATDVFVSEFLGAKVRPVVLEAAQPTVESQRLASRTKRADRMLAMQEERLEDRDARMVIVPPKERWERYKRKRQEKKLQAKQEREAAKRAEEERKAAERALKQAEKDAAEEYKRRLKAAKQAGTKLSKQEKEALEVEVRREYLPEEILEAAKPPKEKEKEKEKEAPEPHAGGKADKELEKEEKKRQKQEAARAKAEEKRERSEQKREKKARKQATKDAKPVVKRRVRRLKAEGKKPSKDEVRRIQEDAIEELVAKALGRPVEKKKPQEPAEKPAPSGDGEEAGEAAEKKDLSKKERKQREKEEKKRAKEEAQRAKEEAKRSKQEEKARKKDEKAAKKAEKGGKEQEDKQEEEEGGQEGKEPGEKKRGVEEPPQSGGTT